MALEKINTLAGDTGITAARIRGAIGRGELNGIKDGGVWLVEAEEFAAWAETVKKPRKTKKNKTQKSRRSCPSCGSANLMSARQAIAAGTYSGEGRLTGVGVGSDGSVAIGVGKNKFSYQSVAAKNVNTANEKNCGEELGMNIGLFIGIILGFVFGISASSFWVGFITFMVCGGVGMYVGKQSGLGQSEALRISSENDEFSRSFVCQSCGHQFTR